MNSQTPFATLPDLARQELDVLIVGSGPAGVAVAEQLYEGSDARIGIVERGGQLLPTHFYNLVQNVEARDTFIERAKSCPWTGDLQRGGGMLLHALGGRGIVAGAHLRRFDEVDLGLWPAGRWPFGAGELAPFYEIAESRKRVLPTATAGPAQSWALGALERYHVRRPPTGADVTSGQIPEYRSSIDRLWGMALHDDLTRRAGSRRLFIASGARAIKIEAAGREPDRVDGVVCLQADGGARPLSIRAASVVLAASPIESARLLLGSGLGGPDSPRPAAGRYLAEHIYYEGDLSLDPAQSGRISGAINVVIPPPGAAMADRFQIEIRRLPDRDGRVRVVGGAAMDPSPENAVTLIDLRDADDVPVVTTALAHSENDRARVRAMCARMEEVAAALGGRYARPPQWKGMGSSYHEAGTLRMGSGTGESVTDRWGQVHGIDNLFVADAAVFPCVGVANPMLTITALGYRLAEHLAGRSFGRGR